MLDINGYYHEYGGNTGLYFQRNVLIEIGASDYAKRAQDFISKCSNTDVYRCIYSYSSTDVDNALLYAPLYIDLDGDMSQDFEKLRRDAIQCIYYMKTLLLLKDEDFEIYFSGAKGWHIMIAPEVLDIQPAKDLNSMYKAWALHIYHSYNIRSVDLKVYDRKRLFRLPGTINSKTGMHKTYVDIDFLKSCTYQELKLLAENPMSVLMLPIRHAKNEAAAQKFREMIDRFNENKPGHTPKREVVLPKEKQELLPCIKEMLNTSIGKGTRNNTLAVLASALLQSGYTKQETVDMAISWNSANDPPMSDSEVEHTCGSVYSMLMSGRSYGCNSIKELGYCTGECKLQGKG